MCDDTSSRLSCYCTLSFIVFFFFKQKTAYEMRISDWSSDVCSSDLFVTGNPQRHALICFSNAFHGRTLGTISATNQEKMRGGFEPLLPGFTVDRTSVV